MPLAISASRIGPVCCDDLPKARAMSPLRWGPEAHRAVASRQALCGSDSRAYHDLKKCRPGRPIAASLNLATSSLVMGETAVEFQACYLRS